MDGVCVCACACVCVRQRTRRWRRRARAQKGAIGRHHAHTNKNETHTHEPRPSNNNRTERSQPRISSGFSLCVSLSVALSVRLFRGRKCCILLCMCVFIVCGFLAAPAVRLRGALTGSLLFFHCTDINISHQGGRNSHSQLRSLGICVQSSRCVLFLTLSFGSRFCLFVCVCASSCQC